MRRRREDSKDRTMRNLKLILSYDGAEFSGWQVQPDAATVQGTLASAIGRITAEKVLPQGSGRTDAGVHALAQVVTFVTESSVPTENFVKALNDILPASIRVLEVTRLPPDFHARQSAHAKTYRYRIYRGVDLSAVSGAIRVALSVSARRRCDGCGRRAWWWANTISLRLRRWIPRRRREEAPASNVRTIFSSAWESRQG